jgi:hypothetical protein
LPRHWEQVAIRFNKRDAGILKQAAGTENLTEAVRSLIGDGIRWNLQRRVHKPLSTQMLSVLHHNAMRDLYEQMLDALAGEVGTKGPLDNRYRLEPVPCRPTEVDGGPGHWPLRDDEVFLPGSDITVNTSGLNQPSMPQ